jgi:hypothetical protein
MWGGDSRDAEDCSVDERYSDLCDIMEIPMASFAETIFSLFSG